MEINTEELYNEVLKKIEEITVTDIPNYYDEESLVSEYSGDFDSLIKHRGMEYYNNNKIVSLFKSKNKYYGKVEGSSGDTYNVLLEVYDDHIEYSCDCPYEGNCKHEYALLNAISNKDYEQVNLKKILPDKMYDMHTIIETIPAEEIKEYLLSPVGKDKVAFETKTFEQYFRKYLPKHKYDYYYNNLYNELVLNYGVSKKIYTYIERAKEYLSGDEFREVFKIIKATINAYKDSNHLNSESLIDLLPSIGMYLRIVYRKADDITKRMIDSWVTELEKQNYYNNYYLEDVVLSLR